MDEDTKQQNSENEIIHGNLRLQFDDEISSDSHELSTTTKDLCEEDPLDVSPPDFELAKIHQNASRVKFMSERKISASLLNNSEMYCPCCQMPTSKAAPKIPF